MHRNVTRTIAALGFAGAIAVGLTATPAAAQGIYFGGPGVSVGIGDGGWYGHRRYYRDYGYYDHRPYRWGRHYGYRYRDDW
jgi:hypothetical protein